MSEAAETWVTSTIESGVMVISLDRPAKKNALTAAMRDTLYDLLQQADSDDNVAVVIVTATGSVFSAGVDLVDAKEGGRQQQGKLDPGAALRATRKATLCVVNGVCVTGALELALSCDMIIASERATFADTHATLGLLPWFGMSALLPRAVGLRKAKELTATGRHIDADEALQIGLVNHVVSHEQLHDFSRQLALQICRADTAAVQKSFELYDVGQGQTLDQALALESEASRHWQHDLDAANRRRSR